MVYFCRKMKILITIAIIIVLAIIYYYPFQYCLAQRNFEEYIRLQGVQSSDIADKIIHKDYKQDGYWIRVVYKSDPNFYYDYKFSMSDNSKIFSYKSIYCTIYNHKNTEVGVTGESDAVKYPPLDEDA